MLEEEAAKGSSRRVQTDRGKGAARQGNASYEVNGAGVTPRYNYLGHDDFSGLHAIASFLDTIGSQRRFFLSIQTLNTHAPYGQDPGADRARRLGCERLLEQDLQAKRTSAKQKVKRPPSALQAATGSITGTLQKQHAGSLLQKQHPGSLLQKQPAGSAQQAGEHYARELRCADRYIEELWHLLSRAGRLRDTTLIVTSDHGEGFAQQHMTDIGHGGTVYDTQTHIPLLIIGQPARHLPRRISGVWSETAIMHTVLDLLELPPHPLVGSPLLQRALDAHQPMAQDAEARADGNTGLLLPVQEGDLLGRSVLRNWREPPTHAFMSCAFESSCIGLRRAHTKWVWRLDARPASEEAGGRLEVYYRGDDYEEESITKAFPPSERSMVTRAMRSWVQAVNAMHEGEAVVDHVCPFDLPFAFIYLYDHYTHCCATEPQGRRKDEFGRDFMLCPKNGQEPMPCSTPPCVDNPDAARAGRTAARGWMPLEQREDGCAPGGCAPRVRGAAKEKNDRWRGELLRRHRSKLGTDTAILDLPGYLQHAGDCTGKVLLHHHGSVWQCAALCNRTAGCAGVSRPGNLPGQVRMCILKGTTCARPRAHGEWKFYSKLVERGRGRQARRVPRRVGGVGLA